MLLAQFSQANTKLASENDKLKAGRQALTDDHAEVLNEIEDLRGRLNYIEDATTTTSPPNRTQSRGHGGGGGGGEGGGGPLSPLSSSS